ncbi:MAG: PD-(D/E)XK nuclease family protein [Pedobacter sp.]|nr:MAG: PD-(D/E)XK nuclease family protein [Pedobacter sp.]
MAMQSFLEEVAQDIWEKKGLNLHQCAILFNNKRPADYFKRHLAALIKKPFWSPKFYTIQEFIADSNAYQIADTHTQLFTLYDAYIELLKKEAASYIPSISQFQSIGQIILSDFAQIDMEMVDAPQLFLALEDIATINERFDFLSDEQKLFLNQFWSAYDAGKHQKMQQNFMAMWHRMPALYALFYEKLAAQNLSTSAKMYRLLAERADLGDELADNSLIFVGFNALSKSEVKIFTSLQTKGKALFYFDTDSYYLEDDLQEAGFFVRKNIQQYGLINQLANDRSFIKVKKRVLNVFKIQGDTAQAKVLGEVIQPFLTNVGQDSMSDTAIVLANESLLFPVLQSIPTTWDGQELPVNVTMGMAFKNSSLYGLVELWLETQINYRKQGFEVKCIHYKIIQAFASHPLIGISEKLREKISTALVKQQYVDVPADKMTQFGGLALLFFKEVPTVSNYVQGLIELFEAVLARELANRRLKEIESNLFIAAIKELNRLQDNLKAHLVRYAESEIEVSFISSIILKSLQNVAVPLSGEATQGLQVMGLLESRNLNFKNLFVLGANEGIMPKGAASSSFIPESLRLAYGLPILAYQDAISAYMFYRLIQRAENIHVFYNAQTDEKSTGERSRFIAQLAYESGFELVEKELQLTVITEPKELLSIPKDDKVQAALSDYLNLKKVLSASAFTTYILNPVDFFFRYLAKLEEPKIVKEQVEANMVGNILHAAMEEFYHTLTVSDPQITASKIQGLIPELDAIIKRCTIQKIYELEKYEEVQLKGLQKVVVAIVRKYVDLILKEDLKKVPFQIVKLEHKDNYIHSFKGPDGSFKQIKLFGIFDRIDLKDGVYSIIDYKTGSDELKFTSIEDNYNAEQKSINKALLQTLFYAYIYEKSKGIEQVQLNLYVLKKMKNGEVHFTNKSQGILSGPHLEEVKTGFVGHLDRILNELFNPDVPFKASAKASNYVHSIYKDLFGGV